MVVKESNLIPLGVGIGIGALSLWAAIELFPFIVVGGAGYIIYQGLTKQKENTKWEDPGQDQK